MSSLIAALDPTTSPAATTMATTVATTSLATIATTIGPFTLLLLAIPVLLMGEQLINRIRWLRNSNIPAPIIGGLIVAVALLIVNETGLARIKFDGVTTNVAWLWPVLPQWDFSPPGKTAVERPLLILFFTCIGLNASWAVAKRGGFPLLIYLAMATAFAFIMNAAGVLTAKMIGEDPLLGLLCSGVSLMGGFGTSAAFAPDLQTAGLANAGTIGIAAAAFGVIAGGLIAGPVAARLMATKVRVPEAAVLLPDARPDAGVSSDRAADEIVPSATGHPVAATPEAEALVDTGGFVDDVANMARQWPSVLVHLIVLIACLKLGAFFSVIVVEAVSAAIVSSTNWLSNAWTAGLGWMQVDPKFKLVFPVYMGSMIVAALIRNIHDIAGFKVIDSLRTDLIASFALAWLLSVVMITLKLGELVHTAGPMLVILAVQIVIIAAFAYWVVFRVMGRDYEAAAMSAGFIGFAAGTTSNAVATMKQLARNYGPAPRAFLIVTVVGAFLIDFTNAVLITLFMNYFKH